MTDLNKTAIALVIDRSGSMGSIRQEAENSVNEYIREQKELDGELLIEIVDFDNTVETQIPLTSADNVSKYTLTPRGLTALHDAMGQTINSLGAKLAAMPENERPGRVLFVTVTDGGENASREFDAGRVKALVKRQTDKYGWDFVFLAANQDAIVVGGALGHSTGSSLTFDPQNVAAAANSLSHYTTSYRGSGAAAFADSDRSQAVDSNS